MKYLLIIVLLVPLVVRAQTSVQLPAVVHLSTMNPDLNSPMPGDYVEKIGSQFFVSVHIQFDAASLPVPIHRLQFAVRFFRDPVQYDYQGTSFPSSYSGVADNPMETFNGWEDSLHLDVTTSTSGITTGDELCEIPFDVMLAKETTTPFVISNITYLDDQGNSISGITTVADTGVLFIEDVCPSNILRNFLNGSARVSIAHLSPNPVGVDASVLVDYSTIGATVPVNATIYNELGLPIKTISLGEAVSEGHHQALLDTRDLAAGTYSLRVVAPSSTAAARFVVYR